MYAYVILPNHHLKFWKAWQTVRSKKNSDKPLIPISSLTQILLLVMTIRTNSSYYLLSSDYVPITLAHEMLTIKLMRQVLLFLLHTQENDVERTIDYSA